LDESLVYQPFLEWLASVTERVNETMHYESSGQPSPVIFHVPHVSWVYFLKLNIKKLFSCSDLLLLLERANQQRGQEKAYPDCHFGAKAQHSNASTRKLHQVYVANHQHHPSQKDF
jgi:hypothetical protein